MDSGPPARVEPSPTTSVTPNVATIRLGVTGHDPENRHGFLLATLESLYPVEFRRIAPLDYQGLNGLVILDGDVTQGEAAAAGGWPTLVVGAREGAPVPKSSAPGRSGEVRLGAAEVLDEALRHQMMRQAEADQFAPLTVRPGDEIVATVEGQPVWLARRVGGETCQIAGALPPVVREHAFLFPHLNDDHFLGLLPLLNFVRQRVKATDWQPVSVPACIVIDDPSPYRPSYGHFNFRRLAELATRHNFFVSVGMIPLDTWYVHPGVAETFRAFNPRLSAVIHGNNHTSHELQVPRDESAGRRLAAQAMRRMARLPERHGMELMKIMEAPHGVIAETMFPHLLALGYEAALGTTEQLIRGNPGAGWPAGLGLERTLLPGGLPVIPRIRMSADWRNNLVLAAFLRQPMVIALHHWDLADGDDFLIEVAGLINRLTFTTWTSPLGMARSNYTVRRCDDEWHVKAYSRKFSVAIPPGIKSLRLHRPWLEPGNREELVIRQGPREIFRGAMAAIPDPIPVESPGELEIGCVPANLVDPQSVPAPRFSGWPVLRKVLMEVRDRSAPWRRRVKKRWRPPARPGNGEILSHA